MRSAFTHMSVIYIYIYIYSCYAPHPKYSIYMEYFKCGGSGTTVYAGNIDIGHVLLLSLPFSADRNSCSCSCKLQAVFLCGSLSSNSVFRRPRADAHKKGLCQCRALTAKGYRNPNITFFFNPGSPPPLTGILRPSWEAFVTTSTGIWYLALTASCYHSALFAERIAAVSVVVNLLVRS